MRRQQVHETWYITRPRVAFTAGGTYVHARNRTRTRQAQLILTEEIEEMFGEDYAMYVWGYLDEKSNLNIIKRVEKPNGWR